MADRAAIIRAATEKSRKSWEDYVALQNRQLYTLYQKYADSMAKELARAEKGGSIPAGKATYLNDEVKQSIPPFRKAISGSIVRGISNSVDYGFKTQILAMNAAGIANRLIQLGTSFIGKDGQVVRWDAGKETFLQSAWSRMNKDAVNAVIAWKPGGIAFSDRVWDVTWTVQKKTMGIIQNGIANGTSAANLSRELRKYLLQPETLRGKALRDYQPGVGVYKSAYKNAMRLASTELNRAFNEATVRYGRRKDWIEGFIWRPGSYDPCDQCDPFIDKFFPKDEAPQLPLHPHCLPAGMVVCPCGDTLGATSRDYCGDLVTIETAGKYKLTCTPNHPVLTRDGWVPANALHVGSYVVSSGRRNGRFVGLHDIQEPALIEEVVGAFRKTQGVISVPVPVSTEDFHGDGIGSKIAVVSTDGFLRDSLNFDVPEILSQVDFILRDIAVDIRRLLHSLCVEAFTLPRRMGAANGVMGGMGAEALALCGATAGLKRGRLIEAADMDASSRESVKDNAPAYTETIRQALHGFARKIERRHLVGWQGNDSLRSNDRVRLLVGSQSAIDLDDTFADRGIANAKVLGDIYGRFPAVIPPDDLINGQGDRSPAATFLRNGCILDRITHVHTSHYQGPIYNLMTTQSYYFVDGIASHNCRCRLDLFIKDDPKPGDKGFAKSNTAA